MAALLGGTTGQSGAAPPGAGAGGLPGAAATPPEPALDTGSSEGLLQSLAAVPASSFVGALGTARAAIPAIQTQEKADLEASFPEIERPTGLPSLSTRAPVDPTVLGELEPSAPEMSGPREGAPPETGQEVAVGHVPDSQVATSIDEPASEEEGSWWSWLVDRVRAFVSQLPTNDLGLSTSAGPRSRVDLSGDARPDLTQRAQQAASQDVVTSCAAADTATMMEFGEGEIYPDVPAETLRPAYKPGPPPSAGGSAGATQPAMSPEARAAFDQNASLWTSGQVNQGLTQHRIGAAEYQTQSAEVRAEGQRRIDVETELTRAEQEGQQQQAQIDVDAERQRWRNENRQIQERFATQSETRRAEVDRQIGEKVRATENEADQKLANAEARAEQARVKAEADAAAKKREVENRPRSWWDRVKGAIRDALSAVRRVVNDIFDAARKVVRGIIDTAKAAVRGLIDAARAVIVGAIKMFGEAVKGMVSIALAAFPDAAASARAWIDDRVDGAVDTVNAAAEALKTATDAILDWVGQGLDLALAVWQGAFNLFMDGLQFFAVGLIELMELLDKLVGIVTNIGPIIDTIQQLIRDPAPIIEAIKGILGSMIATVPDLAKKSAIAAITFSDPPKGHVEGILKYLQPMLEDMAANWWEIIKKSAWHLIWPFAEDSPIWTEVPELLGLIGEIFKSIWDLDISKATDQFLRATQLVNSIVGLFFGWVFIGLVGGFAIAGGIAGAEVGVVPGVIAGAAAGAAIAGEIGMGLLIAALATEGAIVAKSGFDLVFTTQSAEEDEEDYQHIASSALSIGMMTAMAVLSEIAVRFARAVISRVARAIRGRPAPATPAQRLAARKAAATEQARAAKIREGIEKVDRDIASGKHPRKIPQEDLDWLNADPRRKELAYDPDIGSYRVSEARAAIEAEGQGVVPRPVRRAVEADADFVDGSGRPWSHKGASPNNTTAANIDVIATPARRGTSVLGDLRALNPVKAAAVRAGVRASLATAPGAGEVRFLPAGPPAAVVGGGTAGKVASDEERRRQGERQ